MHINTTKAPIKTIKMKNMFNSTTSLHKIIQVSTRNQLEGLLMNSAKSLQASRSLDRLESTLITQLAAHVKSDRYDLKSTSSNNQPRFESPSIDLNFSNIGVSLKNAKDKTD
jgi:hypothetical protein